MSNTRWVLVDDKDSGINYSGSWFETSNQFSGNWGTPYGGSQHGTNGSASLSYTFTGTRIRVLGTSAVNPATAGQDPTWTCVVGSTAITPNDPWTATINNWPLCESPVYTSGTHTLTLEASVKSSSFLVDQIRYLPLANQSSTLTSATVIVEHDDPDITYVTQESWQPLTSSAMMTLKAGAVVTAKFKGTKLTWVGWTPSGFPTGKSQALYSIDNGPATTFDIAGLPTGSPALYNQHLFETPELQAGEHTLTVTHNGPATPLTLDHLLISNGDIVYPGGGTSGDETQDESSAASGSATPSDGKKFPVAAVAGGVGGGVAFLIILALIIILFLRRRKRRQRLERVDVLKGGVKFPPPIAQVTPFTYANGGTRPAGALNLMSSSRENLSQAGQMPSGWSPPLSPEGGYQPLSAGQESYPRDRKVRPLPQQPIQHIPLRHLNNGSPAPQGPLSDTSSSSGVPHVQLGSDSVYSANGRGDASVSNYSTTHSKSSSGPQESRQVLLHHQDSGIRLAAPPPPPTEIIDVPPSYTPS